MTEPRPDVPLESLLTGQLAAFGVAGVALTAVTLVVADRPWVFLVSTVVGGAVAIGVLWPLSRLLQRRQLERLAPAVGPARRSSNVGIRLGFALGAAAVLACGCVLAVETLIVDVERLYFVAGPLLLVFGASAGLGRRTLLRWQRERGRIVYTRVGGRRFAWTMAQARSRLVTLPAE